MALVYLLYGVLVGLLFNLDAIDFVYPFCTGLWVLYSFSFLQGFSILYMVLLMPSDFGLEHLLLCAIVSGALVVPRDDREMLPWHDIGLW